MFKPSDIFIGVIDFFSVILPGALMTFFVAGYFQDDVFGKGKIFPALTTTTHQWVAFLLATYILGNLIFVLASWFDMFLYGPVRRKIFEKNYDLSYKTATALRRQYIPVDVWLEQLSREGKITHEQFLELSAKDNREIINTFKWGQLFLQLKYPASEAIMEIRKLEADSKFFRSLGVAFILIGVFLLSQRTYIQGGSCLILAILSLYRYCDLRYKSTEKTYEIIITANHLEKPANAIVIPADNREAFMAAPETSNDHKKLMDQFMTGVSGHATLLTVPTDHSWKNTKISGREKLYCLGGRSYLRLKNISGDITTILLIKGALISLPIGSTYEIENKLDDTLLIASVL